MAHRFSVALSFPGEHRNFVQEVATLLAKTFSREQVLYDHYHRAEFARPSLGIYLPNLYRTESALIVIFLCPEYQEKRWCTLEWRHIHDLIETEDQERIMFISFGDPGDLSSLGILKGDGYLNVEELTAQDAFECILERYRQNPKNPPIQQGGVAPKSTASTPKIAVDRIGRYAPVDLIGRQAETQLLNDTWEAVMSQTHGRTHILTFVALGGEGKTSLVAKWLADLAQADWPGCKTVFAWSFYSQGTREQMAASSDLFLTEALKFFGDSQMAESTQGAYEKGQRLAQLAGAPGSLLILDGLEPLQYAPTSPTPGELKDQGITALLKGLAAQSHGLCVVTTRYALPDLRNYKDKTVQEKSLNRLSREAGVHLLQTLGVHGSELKNYESTYGHKELNEFEALVEDVKGHALTINLLGTYLRDAHGGDIRQRDLIKLETANDKEQGGHAFRVIEAYVKALESEGSPTPNIKKASWPLSIFRLGKKSKAPLTSYSESHQALAFLKLLGLFDRPATIDCLEALWQAPAIPQLTEPLIGLNTAQRNIAIKHLEDSHLLTVNRDSSGQLLSLDAHPLLREYFAKYLRETQPDAWQAAHKRLYQHLCDTPQEDGQPTIEDLQPLFQAVAHGCLAGLYQETCDKLYSDRINRGTGNDGFYVTKKLGAYATDLGAVACFFESPWTHVSTALSPAAQSWLLAVAAFNLRAVGRLKEALEPMQAGLEMRIQQENWDDAARIASNLSELQLTLGQVPQAVQASQQAVSHADKSQDAFLKIGLRTTHADALHQAGQPIAAEERFREAEAMQAKRQPHYPSLYSLSGFRYCDLLLSQVEQAAAHPNGKETPETLIAQCQVVEQRAAQTLNLAISANLSLLSIALATLTLGRTALYLFILDLTSPEHTDKAQQHIADAVSGLRKAGSKDHIPRGLITRAWFRSCSGNYIGPGSVQADLDEAWEISERGSMRLFMADTHLYRARLFGQALAKGEIQEYPWGSPQHDLAEARRLIEECGYWRRKAELEAAEAMLA